MPFDVTTYAGTDTTQAVQLLNSSRHVVSISFKARRGNTGKFYVGLSSVTDTHGWELDSGGGTFSVIDIDLSGRSQAMSDFYGRSLDSGDFLDARMVYE